MLTWVSGTLTQPLATRGHLPDLHLLPAPRDPHAVQPPRRDSSPRPQKSSQLRPQAGNKEGTVYTGYIGGQPLPPRTSTSRHQPCLQQTKRQAQRGLPHPALGGRTLLPSSPPQLTQLRPLSPAQDWVTGTIIMVDVPVLPTPRSLQPLPRLPSRCSEPSPASLVFTPWPAASPAQAASIPLLISFNPGNPDSPDSRVHSRPQPPVGDAVETQGHKRRIHLIPAPVG